MNYLSNQETFDKVYDWFVTNEGKFSYDHEGGPAYWGMNGARCPIGVCLTVDQYNLSMEGINIIDLVEENTHKLPWTEEQLSLLVDLQDVHDRITLNGSFPEYWDAQLKIIAHRHNLTIPQKG